MRKYTYLPPKVKISTKLVDVMDEFGNKVFTFKRVYKNFIIRFIDSFLLDRDYFVQFDVFTNDGQLRYQVKKIPRWGKTQYSLIDHKTSQTYSITYKSWQVISPELLIKSESCELTVQKAPMDWAKFYYQGKGVARWRMKTSEWFKAYLEIEEDSPIQEPEFFTAIAQILFYVGE